MIDYEKKNIPLAKKLRKEMTPWERKLWYLFLRTYPIRFQRQKAIGNYIVDFYCARAKIAIELDGSGHFEPQKIQEDAARTASLGEMGVRILRIPNNDIDRCFPNVCEYIDAQVRSKVE